MESLLLLIVSFWVLIILVQMKAYSSACLEEERISLLEIKEFLTKYSPGLDVTFDTWVDDEMSDCCTWDRVTCNNATSKHVIAIALDSIRGRDVKNLGDVYTLNLSLFHPFEELHSLDLTHNLFDGCSNFGGSQKSSSFKKLQVIDLSFNYLNSDNLSFLSAFPSLKTLILGSNKLAGSLPSKELGNLKNLEVLDLSYNHFNGTLSMEGLCGSTSLLELSLSGNHFSGSIPQCLGNLSNLQVLDLSTNKFSGNIQSVISKLTSLKYLFLSENEFEGLFSFSSLANHTKLEIFDLSSGSTMLEFETETPAWVPTFQLRIINLPNCKLNVQTRTVPSFLLYQQNLQFIDLSHLKLVGTFPSWILQNNSRLEVLNLMNNSFAGTFQLPNFKHKLLQLEISNNGITGQLPEEIGLLLSKLFYINMSKNSFEGNVPFSIGKMEGLTFLDLSNNNFSGELPGSLFANCSNLSTLILSNNNFQGNIFHKNMNLTSLSVFDMKNNNFSGKIDVDFLYSPSLTVLDISNNNVEGTIPIQLCNLSSLNLLDLSQNMLSGSFPSCFDASSLRHLFLQKNGLSGFIPHALSTSSDLVALDLRGNKFSGNIPSWIIQLPRLRVLLLGGNGLQGRIPSQLCQIRSLNIMDLSNNLLHGSIPSCFNNISFEKMGRDDFAFSAIDITLSLPVVSYDYHNATVGLGLPNLLSSGSEDVTVEIEFRMKHRYNSYKGYIISLMAGIDLSCNNLSGEIPIELGELHEIRSLNLSHNHLSGSIPVSFSNLKSIESLDLRNNNLSGEIPSQLVELNFLATFDVSYNNLSGRVPDKEQFGTFDESNYRGNPGLCGALIHRSCNTEAAAAPPPSPSIDVEEEDEGAIDMFWFYWSFFASYVTVLLVLAAVLCINRYWCMLWFQFIDFCIYSFSTRLLGTVW